VVLATLRELAARATAQVESWESMVTQDQRAEARVTSVEAHMLRLVAHQAARATLAAQATMVQATLVARATTDQETLAAVETMTAHGTLTQLLAMSTVCCSRTKLAHTARACRKVVLMVKHQQASLSQARRTTLDVLRWEALLETLQRLEAQLALGMVWTRTTSTTTLERTERRCYRYD
jgi:hypothetical protein